MIQRTTMFPSSTGALASTRSIVSNYSSNGYNSSTIADGSTSLVLALTGSLTAGVLKTMVSISGAGGTMSNLSYFTADTTSRTVRVKIVCDGITAYDYTSGAMTLNQRGATFAGSSSGFNLPSIKWTSTIIVEIASSLTETDKTTLQYAYNTEA